MTRIIFFFLAVFFIQSAFAQSFRKTNFTAPLKKTDLLIDPTKVDYAPAIIHLDQHPIPFAEYGDKKRIVQEWRDNSVTRNFTSNKTRGNGLNPVIDTGWGANYTLSVPMDNDIAVSNSGIVISAVNTNIRVYDTVGNYFGERAVQSLDSLAGTFNRVSDPRLLYDPNADRFILVCFSGSLSYESNILIGFSATNDPLQNWNFYTVTGNPFNDSTWSDYPIISISDKDMFMTFNQIQDNVSWQTGFRQSVIYQIQKTNGFQGTPLQYTLYDSIKFGNTLYRNICPAKYQETNMGDEMYFLSVRNVDFSNDSVFILHIDKSYQSGTAVLTQRVVKSPVPYGLPPNPRMKNGENLMTNDGRVLAAIYENDYIYFGANSINTADSSAGVYLGRIENVSSPTPKVSATIFSDATIEYAYPSMAYMGDLSWDHSVYWNFSHCYKDSFPGMSVVYSDNNGYFSDIVPVLNGTGSFNKLLGSDERWGDYSGIQRVYNNKNKAYLAGTFAQGSNYRAYVAKLTRPSWPVSVQETEKRNTEVKIYPNPTDARFTATFSLQANQRLQFNLYEMNGRLISTLLNRECKAGKNEFSFDTGALASGNYVLSILGEEQNKILTEVITKK